ncbi:3'-5' exonuclease [Saccharospirillum salsuginis]|uniref:Uncharacterized protein n=1 Tax=Saccharospirillum salsuginis TaxID=418750 RepID=A0A918K6H0_9GAMM|nr:hypothetical protein [Saccharospirillum salsuginis]GGX51088.1 hypothetical protein GCM10007392_17910 [Saccharospirillum salsuginis]
MLLPGILDIEASGFGRGSYPIEVGVATETGDEYAWLITPEPDWDHWDDDAEAIHGIRRDQLLSEGYPVTLVADQLNELLEGQIMYSDGWGFDSGWLALLFYHARKTMTFRLETLPRILSDYQLSIWDETKERIRREQQLTHHRAGKDARVLQLTFEATQFQEHQQHIRKT